MLHGNLEYTEVDLLLEAARPENGALAVAFLAPLMCDMLLVMKAESNLYVRDPGWLQNVQHLSCKSGLS
jgi:hypothetical protein